MKCISAQNCCIRQAHDNTSHGGLDQTHQNLRNTYYCKDSFSHVKTFVESCEICQTTKSSTQKHVALLTPLILPQRPWIEIAMHIIFLKQLVVYCT